MSKRLKSSRLRHLAYGEEFPSMESTPAKPAKQAAARTALTNRTAVRRFTLEIAKKNRAHNFPAVSAEFLDAAETHLRLWIASRIHAMPSKGSTIK